MTDSTEIELLRAAQDGDMDAFAALCALLEPALLRFTRRLIGVDYEDVVQDTLTSLYLNLSRIDPPEKLRPYVFRIARNRCYDLLRAAGRHEETGLDSDEDEIASVRIAFNICDDANTPEDATHWLLVGMEVRAAMDQLPELQRQALILYSEEELSYAEIAEVMGVNIGTVKSRLHHAKKTLRGLLSVETLRYIDQELEA